MRRIVVATVKHTNCVFRSSGKATEESDESTLVIYLQLRTRGHGCRQDVIVTQESKAWPKPGGRGRVLLARSAYAVSRFSHPINSNSLDVRHHGRVNASNVTIPLETSSDPKPTSCLVKGSLRIRVSVNLRTRHPLRHRSANLDRQLYPLMRSLAPLNIVKKECFHFIFHRQARRAFLVARKTSSIEHLTSELRLCMAD